MAGSQTRDKGPADYGREAIAEWSKAARYGTRAIAAKRRERAKERPPLKERLNPATTEKGGRLGDVVDAVLSKFGTGGKLASKVSLGSRILERIRDGHEGDGGKDAEEAAPPSSNGFGADVPIPIQASIDVALSVGGVYRLCTRFEDYPEFLDRVAEVEEIDDSHLVFIAKVRGRHRELEVELQDERENERLDWECMGDIEHSGVISFHPLAPRLTRLELTVELEPEGLLERLAQRAHLTERAIREELHRFKAYAELWEEDSDEYEPQDEEGLEDEEPEDEAPEDDDEEEVDEGEELEDEEDLGDEEDFDEEGDLEGQEELEEGEDLDTEELEDEEELEPARSGR